MTYPTRLLILSLAATAFSGCLGAGQVADLDSATTPVETVLVSGQILTLNLNPIVGAQIHVENPERVLNDGTEEGGPVATAATTDEFGNFTLQSFPGIRPIVIEHPGYEPYHSFITAPQENVVIKLSPKNVDIPFHESVPFQGRVECAIEAIIITPSCDTLTKEYNENGAIFEDESVFELAAPVGWETVVLDVKFDPTDYPGVAGIRVSAYAADASAEVFDYQRITQDWRAGDFSLRIDAGRDYGDAVPAPPSETGGAIRFEFYPHGHADDTICTPEQTPEPHERVKAGQCFLGAAVAQDFEFSATATYFVHEPAPNGWTSIVAA